MTLAASLRRAALLICAAALVPACGSGGEDDVPSYPVDADVLIGGTLLAPLTTGNAGLGTGVAITGITGSDVLVALDRRPLNGMLYALGFNAGAGTVQLYCVSSVTAVAAPVGTTDDFLEIDGITPIPVTGARFGMDFSPIADSVRIVTSTGLNFRLNPSTGLVIDGNGGAAGVPMDAAINGGTAGVQATAFTNNAVGQTATTQYTIDAATDALYIQNPSNSGTQTATLPLSGLISAVMGFDIPAGVNVAVSNTPAVGLGYVILSVQGDVFERLGLIDLGSGALAVSAPIGPGGIRGLALQNLAAPPIVALTGDGLQLVRLSSASPGTSVAVAIAGVTAGETLVGIDFRPQTGQLYGLGVNATTDTATLYLLDPQSGAATAVGAPGQVAFVDGVPATIDLPPATSGWGIDFNPTVDRLRVVTGTGLNFRVNPSNGAPVDGDGFTAGINTDGALNGLSAALVGAAYTNSYGQTLGSGVTTLYGIDAAANALFIVDPPNNGTTTTPVAITLGGPALDFTAVGGFDFAGDVRVTVAGAAATGAAWAALEVGGLTRLYRIDLSTGAATDLGQIGAGTAIGGLAVGHATLQ